MLGVHFGPLFVAQVTHGVNYLFLLVGETAETATSSGSLDELLALLGGVIDGFKSGVLPGLAAMFVLMIGVLNFGPLKERLADSKLDWLGPGLTLIAMMGGGVVGGLTGGMGAIEATLTGFGILFTGGGPVVQQLIRDFRD